MTDAATFEHILDLEFDAQTAKASVELAPGNLPLYLKEARFRAYKTAQQKLFTAISALTPQQAKAFGEYRKAQRRPRD